MSIKLYDCSNKADHNGVMYPLDWVKYTHYCVNFTRQAVSKRHAASGHGAKNALRLNKETGPACGRYLNQKAIGWYFQLYS